ncbi:Deoxynucleoside kinase like protein [Aduncisulcus paluster]|uniref:Deoxynucleoside kinase like protein n=1 Tax=Aduncisulcus paluster TaxID=2918883 RepID=A0ABQ5JYQ2_9EUKA|nr:Deoxynucleoside kinase like protein [Aduncisulcus paluster]
MIIVIEGNISAGKSTLAKSLALELDLRLFEEPVVENPYLEDFYKDPCKWALTMQLWLLEQRYKTYREGIAHYKKTGQGVLFDRSVYSDAVFAINSKKCGQISIEGYERYCSKLNECLKECEIPHFIIYLDVSPEICYRRIHSMRKRACEGTIPLEYIQSLHLEYLEFLSKMKGQGSVILRINWEEFGSVESIATLISPKYRAEITHSLDESSRMVESKIRHVDIEIEELEIEL